MSNDEIEILHVDDNPELASVVETFLEKENERFVVETVATAGAGLDRLDADSFDCVVSDYDMPGQNGIEFLEAVREQYPDLPFILYTGKGSEEVASEAISAGVTDYLQKEHGTSQYAVLANRIENSVETYRTQRQLADSEERLRLFFEQSPLGVVEWNDEFELVRMNESATAILGYSTAELRGESWERIVPDDHRVDVDQIVSALLENDGGYHSINENLHKDGERICCEWHNRVVTDDTGEVVTIFSQFQDITDREAREQAIERLHDTAEEVLRTETQEQVADIVVRAARDILDMALNSVFLHDPVQDVLEPVNSTERTKSLFSELPTFEPGDSLAWEVFESGETNFYDDVSTVPGRYNPATPIRSEILVPIGAYGVLLIGSTTAGEFDEIDVSLAETLATHAETALERLDRDQELKRQTNRYVALFERSPDIIDVRDSDGTLLDVNARFCEKLGYDRDAVIGMPIWEIDRLADADDVATLLADVVPDAPRTFAGEYERIDGTTIPVEGHVLKLDGDGADRFIAVSRAFD